MFSADARCDMALIARVRSAWKMFYTNWKRIFLLKLTDKVYNTCHLWEGV